MDLGHVQNKVKANAAVIPSRGEHNLFLTSIRYVRKNLEQRHHLPRKHKNLLSKLSTVENFSVASYVRMHHFLFILRFEFYPRSQQQVWDQAEHTRVHTNSNWIRYLNFISSRTLYKHKYVTEYTWNTFISYVFHLNLSSIRYLNFISSNLECYVGNKKCTSKHSVFILHISSRMMRIWIKFVLWMFRTL